MKTLNQVLDSLDERSDEAYLANLWDEAEIYSKAMAIGFESNDLDDYSDNIEAHINAHVEELTSEQLEVWETVLTLTYENTPL